MSSPFARLRESLAFMRGNIAVLTATRVLGQFGRSMAFPYASLYILSLGGEPEQIGFINSLAPLAGLLVFPLGGYITDHAGRVRLIGIAGFFSAAVYMLYVLAPTWEVIAVAAFLQGFMTLQFPPQSAIIADSLAPTDRGRGIALLNSLGGAPSMFAPYVAGALLKVIGVETGMRYLYGFLGVAYLISAAVNMRFLQETTTPTGGGLRLSEIWRVIKDSYCCIPETLRQLPRSLRFLALVLVLSFLSNAIAGPFWVVYAVERIGLSAEQWGLILLVETATRIVAGIPAGILVDRHGRARFMVFSLSLAAIGLPAFVLARSFAAVMAIRVVIALSNALYLPATAALMADCVPRDIRGRVMAALGRGTVMIGATGGGSGGPGLGFLVILPLFATSLGAGYLYDYRAIAPWLVAASAITICLTLTILFIRDPRCAEL